MPEGAPGHGGVGFPNQARGGGRLSYVAPNNLLSRLLSRGGGPAGA